MKILFVLLMIVFIQVSISYGESNSANELVAFTTACVSSYNMGDDICNCLAGKADERLTPIGFAFLIASMNDDDEKIAELRPQLSMSDSLETGMFMVNTPAECAQVIHAWLAPRYQSHHRVEEVEGWFDELGFDRIEHRPLDTSVGGRKRN